MTSNSTGGTVPDNKTSDSTSSDSTSSDSAVGGERCRIVSTVAEIRTITESARADGRTVGFVPTMGFLHDGHASLMRAARADNDVVVASIFVNPLQFAPGEDLDAYPKDLEQDQALATEAGVDVLFVPSVAEMYPNGEVLTSVSVAEISARWDGESRPTHFTGVATVVSKLFNIVGRCSAYFGQKDFQQLAIIKRMVADLSMPIDVVGCATIREPDGLAMSSRNVYLSPEDRAAAVVLSRAMEAGASAILAGETDPAVVESAMTNVFAAEPRARLDYAAVVDPESLERPERLTGSTQLLVAAYLGTTRLIDNRTVEPDPDTQ